MQLEFPGSKVDWFDVPDSINFRFENSVRPNRHSQYAKKPLRCNKEAVSLILNLNK